MFCMNLMLRINSKIFLYQWFTDCKLYYGLPFCVQNE